MSDPRPFAMVDQLLYEWVHSGVVYHETSDEGPTRYRPSDPLTKVVAAVLQTHGYVLHCGDGSYTLLVPVTEL